MKELEFPFDSDFVSRKHKKLRRELSKNPDLKSRKIAVLGGSTSNLICDYLDLFLLNEGIAAEFYQCEYNKFYEDVMFDNSDFYDFKPDFVYIFVSQYNLNDKPIPSDTPEEVRDLVKNHVNKFTSMWKKIEEKTDAVIIQNNFDPPPARNYGNIDGSHHTGMVNFTNQINLSLISKIEENKRVFLFDLNYWSSYVGLSSWNNLDQWFSYKYSNDINHYPMYSYQLSRVFLSHMGKSKKCLVLDLDNTLWKGVIGEEGLPGIELGNDTPFGEAYQSFQSRVADLKERGIILAVCSKNELKNAKEGLAHPDSILSFEDFISFKANWIPKSQNIKEIAEEINIGVDSLVFIDDNAMEREEVRTAIPSVNVPEVGSNISNFYRIIHESGHFELPSLSGDDLKRNQTYKENKKRANLQAEFESYDDFLKSLEMEATIRPFENLYLERITQLVNKTNQFNLTTMRLTAAQVEGRMNGENYLSLYARLVDRFGDNGIISLVSGVISKNELSIDLWLMSCRVLKRDLEKALFDTIIQLAQEKGITKIHGSYIKSDRNPMVKNHYRDLGFKLVEEKQDGNAQWIFEINKNWKRLNKNIKITH